MQKTETRTQQELSKQVMEMSDVHGPDRQVIRSIGLQILSNGRLEDAVKTLESSTLKAGKQMQGLADAQLKLAKAQTSIAAVAIVTAIILALIFR